MSLESRMSKLESVMGRAGERCPAGPTLVLDFGETVPDDAPRCELCGKSHVLFIIEEVEPSVEDSETRTPEIQLNSDANRIARS